MPATPCFLEEGEYRLRVKGANSGAGSLVVREPGSGGPSGGSPTAAALSKALPTALQWSSDAGSLKLESAPDVRLKRLPIQWNCHSLHAGENDWDLDNSEPP